MKHAAKTFLTISAFISVLGLVESRDAWADGNVWKIGAMLCLTGECAAEGDSSLRGAQIAVDEINAAGGVLGKKIELVVQDTDEAVSGSKTVGAYRHLRINKDIHYMLGPTWTPGGLALVPILTKEPDVIVTSPSLGVKEFHLAADTVFNSRGTDETTTRRTARFAYDSGLRKLAIFSSEQPWESAQARFFEDEFEKLGGKIVVKVEAVPTAGSLKAEALRVAREKPEGVFFANLIQMAIAANDLRKLNFTGKQFAALVDDARLNEAKGALEGTVFFTYQKPSQVFKDKFSSRYGKIPEISAGTGYDTIYAYAKAVEKSGSFDVATVKHAMTELNFEGASGTVKFDSEGCAEKAISGWKIVGLEYEILH